VQGQNSRAVVQALSGMYNNDQDNQTSIQNTTQTNNTRRQISANQIANQWRINGARIQAARQQAAAKGSQKLREFNVKNWQAFLQGKPGVNEFGAKLFGAPGTIKAGADLLGSSNPNEKVVGVRQWLTIAKNQLRMSEADAILFVEGALGGRKKAAPILRRAIRGL